MAKNVPNDANKKFLNGAMVYGIGMFYVVKSGLEIAQSGFSPEAVIPVIVEVAALLITISIAWAIKKFWFATR